LGYLLTHDPEHKPANRRITYNDDQTIRADEFDRGNGWEPYMEEVKQLFGYWYWKHDGEVCTGNLNFDEDGTISSTTVTNQLWEGWWKRQADGLI